jgi:hypothetical protein
MVLLKLPRKNASGAPLRDASDVTANAERVQVRRQRLTKSKDQLVTVLFDEQHLYRLLAATISLR